MRFFAGMHVPRCHVNTTLSNTIFSREYQLFACWLKMFFWIRVEKSMLSVHFVLEICGLKVVVSFNFAPSAPHVKRRVKSCEPRAAAAITRPQWVKPPTFMIYMNNTVFTKIIGHIRHFWWLGPNVWWGISQIWIEYIKPIGQMSDEPWEFFGYSAILRAILHICTQTNRRLFNSDNWNSSQVIFSLYWYI